MTGRGSRRQRIGLLLGPVLFVIVWALPEVEGLSRAGQDVAAVALLMATWWISEAIPIPATALLPVLLFPLLGVADAGRTTANYGHDLIFLFLGGFWIAVTLERWELHRRIALHTIRWVGTSPRRIVLGFMVATAALSMWLSNTATTMMMLPIGMAVLKRVSPGGSLPQTPDEPAEGHFGLALMLGIAYAASIGGVATLIGTPPNAVLAGVVEKLYGYQISFAVWFAFGLPLSLVMLLAAWWYLTRLSFARLPDNAGTGHEPILEELRRLGPLSYQEKGVLIVFVSVALAWIGRGLITLPGLELVKDSTIAMAGAIALFLIPAGKGDGGLLNWSTAVKIPWDIILLFGGGFALADGFAGSGLAEWIALQLNVLAGAGWLVVVAAVALLTLFLTEVTSNTATATMLLPIVASIATAAGIHPLGPMVAAALAASFAFMLPVATPPNAIVFASRCVPIASMARAGVWLNLLGLLMITLFVTGVLPRFWGFDPGVPFVGG